MINSENKPENDEITEQESLDIKETKRQARRRKSLERHQVTCPHCGKTVLDHMTECPFCHEKLVSSYYNGGGKKLKTVRIVIYTVLIAAAVIMVLYILLNK